MSIAPLQACMTGQLPCRLHFNIIKRKEHTHASHFHNELQVICQFLAE